VRAYEERQGKAAQGLGVSESDPVRWNFAPERGKGRRSRSPSVTTDGLESPLVVFAPTRETMYPLSTIPAEAFLEDAEEGSSATGEAMLQDTTKQRGAFVEVKGWGDVLEGESRRERLSCFSFQVLFPDIPIPWNPFSPVLPRRRDGLHQTIPRRRAGPRVFRAKRYPAGAHSETQFVPISLFPRMNLTFSAKSAEGPAQ
jgi:hypothetical protein